MGAECSLNSADLWSGKHYRGSRATTVKYSLFNLFTDFYLTLIHMVICGNVSHILVEESSKEINCT